MPKSPSDLLHDRNLFTSWVARNAKERRREKENWDIYDATDSRSWDEQSLRIMIQEGRPPHSFNFTKRDVDTLAGSSLAEPYDIHYETELGESNDDAILINEFYLEDRDLGNFMFHYLQALRAGFVYRGWLEMYKDYSRGPLPRVGLRYISGDRVVTDPDWNTHEVKDNKGLFIPRWMSPQQIKDKYKVDDPMLNAAIETFKISSVSSGIQEVDKIFDRSPEFWDQQNGLLLVWDFQELVHKKSKKLWDYDNGAWVPDIDDEDIEDLASVARMAGRNIEVMEADELVCMVSTQVPSLHLEVQHGKHPLQLGRYSLFAFSSDSINGRPNTPVDQLKDVQKAFDKRESVKTHILMTAANNHVLVESDAFESTTKAEAFIKNRNRPGGGSVLEPGGIGKIRHLDRAAPPTEFMNDIDRLWQVKERLTPAVPAIQGMGETGDSGVLFQARVAQAQIGMQIPSKMLAAFWHEVGDAYFYAFQQTYTYPMIFKSKNTNQVFYMNYRDGVDVKKMSRLRVSVTLSPGSETYRRILLQTYMTLASQIPSPLMKQALSRLVVQTLPNVPESEKAKLAEIAALEEENQKKASMVQSMQYDLQIAQLQQQQLQMQAGQPIAPVEPPEQPKPQQQTPVPSGLQKAVGAF